MTDGLQFSNGLGVDEGAVGFDPLSLDAPFMVSQLGPLIEEHGSNANGNYVKFSNGLMICWMSISVTNQAINTAYGSLYQGSRTWTFPAVFITAPAVTCGCFKWGPGAAWPATGASASTTDVTLRGIDVVSRATGTACDISATAIGKWK